MKKPAGSRAYAVISAAVLIAASPHEPACGQEAAPAAELLAPVRVEADGAAIDTVSGAVAPCYRDFDGDGRADLLLGQFEGGKLRIYLNRGSNEQPRFEGFDWFQAGPAGDAGHVFPSPQTAPFGGAVGFAPQIVDFDGDGLADILSCSGNGGIVVFRRGKDGKFAEGESLTQPDGRPIIGAPGAAVHAADWDSDGDLDVVMSASREGIGLLRNTGTRERPVYGEPEAFQVEGEPVYARYGSAAPLLADWDGDGLVDLILGAAEGSVTFYRHLGAAADTTLAEGRVLIDEPLFDEEDTNEASKPGRGARPCACDFNADGLLDLLVGDTWVSVETPKAELTDDERERNAAVDKKLAALSKKFSAERQELDGEAGAARDKRLDSLLAISGRMRALRRELVRPPPTPVVTVHGRVWVYLRRNAKEAK